MDYVTVFTGENYNLNFAENAYAAISTELTGSPVPGQILHDSIDLGVGIYSAGRLLTVRETCDGTMGLVSHVYETPAILDKISKGETLTAAWDLLDNGTSIVTFLGNLAE